jgi:hypothetical protein
MSFTRADAVSSQRQSDTVVGLRFTLEAGHGGSALIDFVHLRPRRLALAFATARARPDRGAQHAHPACLRLASVSPKLLEVYA